MLLGLSLFKFIEHHHFVTFPALRELFTNFTSLNLAFDIWRNTSTLSEFIGYLDFTDCREISLAPSRDNDKPKRVG